VATKRSSSRLANSKLAKIPVARCGEILLMRRLDMGSSELDGTFRASLSGDFADKVLDSFPLRKANANKARVELLSI
jgi:hypothetical protein